MHKNLAMKPSFLRPAAFVFFLAACQVLEPPLPVGSPRINDDVHTVVPGSDTHKADTALLVSALCYPPSYDWRKDSLFGRVSCTVKLFRDGAEYLSVPAGPGTLVSSSHDAHHIIDGSLFTEYSDSRQTVVCRDGAKASSWSGRERLVGLMPADGMIYTLGCASDGLVYRKNGVEVLRIDECVPSGGFRFNTYGQYGALYKHDGAVCFMFHTIHDGVTRVFAVLDGELKEVFSRPGAEVLDAKMLPDGPAVLYKADGVTMLQYGSARAVNLPNSEHVVWEGVEIALIGGLPEAVGYCRRNGEQYGSFWIMRQNYSFRFINNVLAVYFRDGTLVPVYAGKDVPEGCLFLSRDCACLSPDGSLTLALSPKDESESPYVLLDGERTEYPVHGIITGVSFHISD